MLIAGGMDVHAEYCWAHFVYADIGEVPERHRKFLNKLNKDFEQFTTTSKSMARLINAVQKHECHILIENSTVSCDVYWMLNNQGVFVTVAQAQDLYRITKSVKKTDRNDSIELSGYMRRRLNGEDEFAECFIPSPDWMTRREMCRGISTEKDYLTKTKLRIRAYLLLHGMDLGRKYSDITCDKALREMAAVKDPYLMMQIRYAQDAKKRVDMMMKVLEHMFWEERMFQLILSIPGFGVLSAAYFTSLIVDITRFPNSSSFTAAFGVVPKMRASANSNPNCSTTHRGDELARYLLMFCVLAHIKHEPDSVVTLMYKRLVDRGKPKRETLVAAGRKLLTVVYAVLRDDRPYVSDVETLMLAKETEEALEEDGDSPTIE